MDNHILVYTRNVEQKINFPCKDMDHANQFGKKVCKKLKHTLCLNI